MPLVNYCRKCKAEVSNGSVCPRCGSKLTKAGERLSFHYKRTPVTDWFSWNAMLRVAVPVMALVMLTALLAEACAEGETGVINVLTQGFFMTILLFFGVLLLLMLFLLLLQGHEDVRYALDAKGARVSTYINRPSTIRLYARLMSAQPPTSAREDEPNTVEGEVCVRHTELLWAQIRRAQYWPETHTILLYRPRWWQAICIRCGAADYGEAEAFVRAKLEHGRKRTRKRR